MEPNTEILIRALIKVPSPPGKDLGPETAIPLPQKGTGTSDWGTPPPPPRQGQVTPRAVSLLRFPAGGLSCLYYLRFQCWKCRQLTHVCGQSLLLYLTHTLL